MKKNIDKIKNGAYELIENGEIKKTIDYLNRNIDRTKNENRLNYLILIESRFNDLIKTDTLGIITQEDFQIRKNKLKLGLSRFIDKLDDPNAFLIGPTFNEFESIEDLNRKTLRDIRVILILILIGIIFIILKLY